MLRCSLRHLSVRGGSSRIASWGYQLAPYSNWRGRVGDICSGLRPLVYAVRSPPVRRGCRCGGGGCWRCRWDTAGDASVAARRRRSALAAAGALCVGGGGHGSRACVPPPWCGPGSRCRLHGRMPPTRFPPPFSTGSSICRMPASMDPRAAHAPRHPTSPALLGAVLAHRQQPLTRPCLCVPSMGADRSQRLMARYDSRRSPPCRRSADGVGKGGLWGGVRSRLACAAATEGWCRSERASVRAKKDMKKSHHGDSHEHGDSDSRVKECDVCCSCPGEQQNGSAQVEAVHSGFLLEAARGAAVLVRPRTSGTVFGVGLCRGTDTGPYKGVMLLPGWSGSG